MGNKFYKKTKPETLSKGELNVFINILSKSISTYNRLRQNALLYAKYLSISVHIIFVLVVLIIFQLPFDPLTKSPYHEVCYLIALISLVLSIFFYEKIHILLKGFILQVGIYLYCFDSAKFKNVILNDKQKEECLTILQKATALRRLAELKKNDINKTINIVDKEVKEIFPEFIEKKEDPKILVAPNGIINAPNTPMNTVAEITEYTSEEEDHESTEFEMDVGREGEIFIFNLEIETLLKNNLNHLAAKVKHVSLESDSYGYDILSFTSDGKEKYIEVKTTIGNQDNNIYITRNELNKFVALKGYCMYRVYNFNLKSMVGSCEIFDSLEAVKAAYDIFPIQYQVTPNKLKQ